MPLKFNIDCENFGYYFLSQSSGMSEKQKDQLPKELLYKLFIKGHRINTKSSSKLGFIEKMYVLVRALNKRFVVLIEDDEQGMTEKEFFEYKEQTKKRNYTSDSATNLESEGIFVLGNNELLESFHRLNNLSKSPAYNYLARTKNKNYLKPDEWKTGMNLMMNWINNYESQRKKITMQAGINMAEWIVLTYLYDGIERQGSFLYKEKFKYSYNTSSTKIRLAFCTLQNRGFIVRNGIKAAAKFQITPLGKAKLNEINSKYLVNC